MTIDAFKQASQTLIFFDYPRPLTESRCRDRRAYKWSGSKTPSAVPRHVSRQPVNFDRLRNTGVNVLSRPTPVANLASREGSIERTNYNSQMQLKGPVPVIVKEARSHGGEMCKSRVFQGLRMRPRAAILSPYPTAAWQPTYE